MGIIILSEDECFMYDLSNCIDIFSMHSNKINLLDGITEKNKGIIKMMASLGLSPMGFSQINDRLYYMGQFIGDYKSRKIIFKRKIN